MGKNVIVISTSLRANSNSAALAEEFARGARNGGNEVEFISLRGKKIDFCVGCLSCQNTGRCAIKDDAAEIEEKLLHADVVVFASPIYYYGMSGQMKTLLDRLNPLYPKDYSFRDIYFLTAAAEDEANVPEKAVIGLQGWVDCFEKASIKGVLFCGGVNAPGDIDGNAKLNEAYEMGKTHKIYKKTKGLILKMCSATSTRFSPITA